MNPSLEPSCLSNLAKFDLDSNFVVIFFFNDVKTRHLLGELNVLMIENEDATFTLGRAGTLHRRSRMTLTT